MKKKFGAIEKNVPIYSIALKKKRKPLLKYPWDKLKTMESMLVPKQKNANAAVQWAIHNGRKFLTRKATDGYRIWRIR